MGLFDRFCNKSKGETEKQPDSPVNEKALEAAGGDGEGQEVKVENPNQDTGRIQWSSPTEFMLTCVGYSVGLGNVWRFPYLCYKSGGGAFLIPYMIMICLIGMPLLFMEYGFGQYFGVGSLSIYKKVCPMLQGIGIGYTVLNALVCVYYNVIIALSLYYIFASFTSVLPWSHCNNEWNTPACGDPISDTTNTTFNSTSGNFTSEYTFTRIVNGTNVTMTSNLTRVSPSDEYFRLALMNVGPEHNIENIGHIQWKICLCLLLAWILVVLFVSKGIKSTGKVAYFTATFPYVMLTVLVVRGVTLTGATEGIIYFVKPDFNKLLDPEVWFAAATQLFYSTNLAWGGMITMASYNEFSHNCYRDAIVINIVSFFTSIYAGFAVFSIIGYMANEYQRPVTDIIDSGPGLAFIVYPRALSLMPLAPMWSALFFFMLFLLGIGSQMVDLETVMTGLVDEVAIFRRHRFKSLIVISCILFLLGLPQTCQGGMYVLSLMDHYSAGFCVLVIAIFECVCINWIYGIDRFAANMKEILGFKPNIWWTLCWRFISPIIIVAILVFSFVKYTPAKYGAYFYPFWADSIGWVLTMSSIVPIFIVAIYKLAKADGETLLERYRKVTTPKIEIEDKNPMKPHVKIDIADDDEDVEESFFMTSKEKQKEANDSTHDPSATLMTEAENHVNKQNENSYV